MTSILESIALQWRSNARLRIAIGVAALVGTLHVGLGMSDARQEQAKRYQADRALLNRLEGAAADVAWTDRADAAEVALRDLQSTMIEVAGSGEAQAELQALLSTSATAAGMLDPRVRSEGALDVEGLPDVWQVVARLDASTTPAATEALLRALATNPWIRVERIEIRDGTPGQIQIIARAYFRRAAEELS